MKRMGRFVSVVAVAGCGAAAASAALTPQAELTAMHNAAYSKNSVHYVAVNSEPGSSVRMVCDVGRGRGIQRVTVTRDGQTGSARVIVYRHSVFIKGTAFGMRSFFGFSSMQSTKYANRWIFVPYASTAFAALSDGATFGSFLGSLFPPSQLSLVKAGSLIGVRGIAHRDGLTEVETLYAPAHGTPLPVKATTTFKGQTGTDRSTMSLWNEAVPITVPADAIPLSVVTG
ncbi:MAG: hypothetical protein QOG85_710 [Gaiellaceae bacterium]|jgi:hypothetical protein|nr:hypothetical protein [Gaiellaceae bacterium]